jgi:hypothetical protein
MTRAVKLRALTTLALLAIVLATASAVTILRLKNNRCGTCVAERSDLNSPKLWQREVWVLGFLSGMAAMQSGTDGLNGLDEMLFTWARQPLPCSSARLARYCSAQVVRRARVEPWANYGQ